MTITIDDFLAFVDITLDGYRGAIDRLDDDSANRSPDLDGANSPFAIVTHATGAARWWTMHVTLGEPTDRHRQAEFTSRGPVTDLTRLVDELQRDLAVVRPRLTRATQLGTDPGRGPEGWSWTVGSVLMHAYEELAQHLGHLELTVDLVTRPATG